MSTPPQTPPRPPQRARIGVLTPLGALRGPRGIWHDRAFWRLFVVFALLHALDITSTFVGLHTGRRVEGGPLYAVLFARYPIAVGTLVYAVVSLLGVLPMLPLYVWWPAGARCCLAALCGLLLAICIGNIGPVVGMPLW